MPIINTLKGRLILVFGFFLLIVMSAVSPMIFDKMKGLILTKHIISAQRLAHTGAIPIIAEIDEIYSLLPQYILDRSKKGDFFYSLAILEIVLRIKKARALRRVELHFLLKEIGFIEKTNMNLEVALSNIKKIRFNSTLF